MIGWEKLSLVFKIDYHPQIKSSHIKNALTKHWEKISNNTELKKIFPDTPIIALSRTKNLSDDLVRARLRIPTVEEDIHEPGPIEFRPGSPTLHLLEDLETESSGFNDGVFFNELKNDYPFQESLTFESSLDMLEEEGGHISD